jgi:PAS domain S-box-containing protein
LSSPFNAPKINKCHELPATTRSAPETPPAVATTLGVAHLDSELRIVEANDALCEQVGLTHAGARGESLSRFFPPAVRESFQEHFIQLLMRNHGNFSLPTTLMGANGGARDCLVTGVALDAVFPVNTGECAAIVLIVTDTVHTTPLVLAPAPAALSAVPARILEGVASGMSTRQLASRLGLSRQGVEYHITMMLRKLKAPNRTALVARAYALNILVPQCWPPRVRPQYGGRSTPPEAAPATGPRSS